MAEYIEREKAFDAVFVQFCASSDETEAALNAAIEEISAIPAADVRPVVRAKWEDVHIDRPEIADLEVATMFCPHCNRWHNEVYNYGNPVEGVNFCPNWTDNPKDKDKPSDNLRHFVDHFWDDE